MITSLQHHRVTRLTLLDCGSFHVQGGARQIGIPAFLIDTDHGARLLVDGGFPPAYWSDPKAAAEADGLATFGALQGYGPRQTLPEQLEIAGCSLAEITALILTHGHIDHVGGLPFCPHLILTATERADPRPRYFGSARPLQWPKVATHLIDGPTQLCHGLTLLPTPGHTPGHMSIRVDLPQSGTILLAADAINRASEPAEGFADAEDPATASRSAEALFALQRETGALLIYGHDPAQWLTLPKAPQFWA